MEVGGPLTSEHAMRCGTALRGAEPLEAFLKDRRVFAVIVRVHLNIRSRYVDLMIFKNQIIERETILYINFLKKTLNMFFFIRF